MQEINVSELKAHPRNNEFFDDITGEKWDEFLESVKSRGVIEPIVITPDKTIVSGHQRVRACKELGIDKVMCDVHTYDNEDQILQDLLETNIRQRGDVGGSAQKVGKRIKELERIYGIKNGSLGFQGNQYQVVGNNFQAPQKTQEELASEIGITVRTLENYKQLADMIPELSDLVDTGIVTKTTALAIMRELPEDEQAELISQMDTTKKITQREVEKYIEAYNDLKENPPMPDDYYSLKSQISKDNEKIRELENQKRMLEQKAAIIQDDADRYAKLKNDIDFLSKQKSDLACQVQSATELAGLTVEMQELLEKKLAPIKFKRCMERIDNSDVARNNVLDIIGQIENWITEMKQILRTDDAYVVSEQ